jgi:hypothetical protein
MNRTGIAGDHQCCVCFKTYDYGHMNDTYTCTYCNLKGGTYKGGVHVVTGIPKAFCKCGLPWNQGCATSSIFSLREDDPVHAHPNYIRRQ